MGSLNTPNRILILGPFSFNPPLTIDDNQNVVIGTGGTPVVNQIHALKKYTKFKLSLITLTPELLGKPTIQSSVQGINTFIGGMNSNHGIKSLCNYEINTIQECFDSIDYDFIISNFTVEYSLAAIKQKKPYAIIVHDHPWQILKTQKFRPHWILRFFISIYIVVCRG